MGSGQFGVESLVRLDVLDRQQVVDLVGVVTSPARPAGRSQALAPTPIALAAAEYDLGPILTPDRLRSADGIEVIQSLRPELIVLVDYGQIVPDALLGVRHGALNLHPSLLPRHRGASPIPATILAGDTRSGVTLMRMDQGLDTGPIIAQTHVDLSGQETSPMLEDTLEQVGADLLERSVGPWIRGEITAKPQSDEGATLTRPLRREYGRLDPTRSAFELDRQVRAYVPWPGSFVETSIGRLIVHATELRASVPDDRPGLLVAHDQSIALATVEGRLLMTQVQLAGARPMDGAALRRGAPGLVGQTVRVR